MAKFDGKDQEFIFGAFTIPAGHITNIEWPRSRDEIDLTGATQDDKEFAPSERSGVVTINCWDDLADTIRDAFEATTGIQTGQWFRQGNTSGKPKRTSSMFVTNISDPLPHNQGAALTITLRVTGAVTNTTISP